MRTVYMGTSRFGAAVLKHLVATEHRPVLVITRPDRPRGRGQRLAPPPVAEQARGLALELFQPQSVNSEEGRAKIAEAAPEAVVICAYGGLIKEPLLSSYPTLNVHPSLLPRWRGPAPIERAIEAGDDQTGVTIMRPTEELDAGPICAQRSEPIAARDDFGSLEPRLELLGFELLRYSLDCTPPFYPQPADGVTLAPKITAADRWLEPDRAPAELERRVRALSPHIGACVRLPGGAQLVVYRAELAMQPGASVGRGELVGIDGRLLYGCANGVLELTELKPEGGRRMDAASYLRGRGKDLVRS